MSLTVVTAPAEEPVTLAEAKDHLRVTGSDEDALISALITTAREQAELIARRAFVTQTLSRSFDAWPTTGYLELLRPPLQSVTSVAYTDEDGNAGTVSASDYIVDVISEPGRVWLKASAGWPTATLRVGPSIVVTYVAGYGDATDVPERYKAAIKIILGDLFMNREATVLQPGMTAVKLDTVSNLLNIDRGSYF